MKGVADGVSLLRQDPVGSSKTSPFLANSNLASSILGQCAVSVPVNNLGISLDDSALRSLGTLRALFRPLTEPSKAPFPFA